MFPIVSVGAVLVVWVVSWDSRALG